MRLLGIPFAVMLCSAAIALGQPAINPLGGTPAGLSQNLVQVGAGQFTLTIRGSGFTPSSVARAGSTNLTTTYVDAATLTAVVPASLFKTINAQSVNVIDGSATSSSIELKATHRADGNGNAIVNIGDALTIARSAGGLVKPVIPIAVGDVNLSDSVNIGDALVVALFAGGLRTNPDTPVITSATVGASVTLTGTGFSSTAENNVVFFTRAGGGFVSAVAVSVAIGSADKTLSVALPSDAASGPVFVRRKDLGLPGQPFVLAITGSTAPLYISKVNPATSIIAGTTSITLAGSGFDPAPANNTVTFSASGGATIAATPSAASSTSLTVTVPAGAVSGFVYVSVGSQTSNRKSILVSSSTPPLRVNQVYYPDAPGEPVLIEGTGFNIATPSENQVLFSKTNGETAAVVVSAGRTELVVLVPFDAASGVLKVKTAGGTTVSNNLDYTAASGTSSGTPPSISSVLLLDAVSNSTVSELPVNEGNTVQARLRVLDSTGAARNDVPVSYSSINPDVATIDVFGAVTGRKAGFSTLTISGGGVVATATVAVVQVESGVSGIEVAGAAQDSADRIYLAANQDHTIRVAEKLGQALQVYAGVSQFAGLKNDLRLESLFRNPSFLALDQADGSMYVSDSANNVIRRIRPGQSGRVETFAEGFNNPQGIALDNVGNLWVADSGNHVIRRINLVTRVVETVAGQAGTSGLVDATGSAARFNAPIGLAIETESLPQQLDRFFKGGAPPAVSVIVADTNNGVIRRVKANGQVQTVQTSAGSAVTAPDSKPVPITFNLPTGVAVDVFGDIYFTEPNTGLLKVILRTGQIVSATQSGTFQRPKGVLITKTGRVVVTETNRSASEIRYGPPQITSISPDHSSIGGGEKITIQGDNFAPDTIVILRGTIVSGLAVKNTQTIEFTAPALSSGLSTITVQNRAGLAQRQFLVDAVPLNSLPAGYITTVAGGSNYAGEGSPATQGRLARPQGLALDSAGNLYIADQFNNRVAKVDAVTGIITTIAGSSTGGAFNGGDSGDNGPATAAALNNVKGIAVDRAGNLFIAANDRIRKVDAVTGIITTWAGGGFQTGDNIPATSANLGQLDQIVFDASGNLLIVDINRHRIRRIDAAPTRIITTVAGSGSDVSDGAFAGDGGPATSAKLNFPTGVAADSAGNIYISDLQNLRIRKVAAGTGIITTIAGTGVFAFSGDNGPSTLAAIFGTFDLAVDSGGNLFITDGGRIRRIDAVTGIITTVAGNGSINVSGDGGPATKAAFRSGRGVTVDTAGNIYIADGDGNTIRKVDTSGIIRTFAGIGESLYSGDGGPATAAALNFPDGIAFDASGNLHVADSENNRIRRIDAATGIITTVAGNGKDIYSAAPLGDNGLATAATIDSPRSIAFDSKGNLYITDIGNRRVRKVVPGTGIITTVAGNGLSGYGGDNGPATQAQVWTFAIALDSNDNLFLADYFNNRVRKVDATTGIITTIAGTGTAGSAGDNGLATVAQLNRPNRLAFDKSGNFFITENQGRIRKVDRATGIITLFKNYEGVATSDAAGNLFVGDSTSGVAVIRRISAATGSETSIAGGGSPADGIGDNGPATSARFIFITGLAFDLNSNLFVVDAFRNRILAIRGPIP